MEILIILLLSLALYLNVRKLEKVITTNVEKLKERKQTFKQILYVDYYTNIIITIQTDVIAVPQLNSLISFTDIHDKYRVKELEYQMTDAQIVITCMKIV